MCDIESSAKATLPVQTWVMRMPFSCGKRSIMYWYRIGALTSGGAAVKRARPPKIICLPSG